MMGPHAANALPCGVQEIGYFDTEATSGTIMNALNEDCTAVQSAMSERVPAHDLRLLTF